MPPGGAGQGAGQGQKKGGKENGDDQKKKKEALAPPSHFGRKKKKSKGTQVASKLPTVVPNSKCRLRMLKHERTKDYLMMEEEFIQEQQRLKPKEDRDSEERSKLDDLRGSPMDVGSLEEFIDEDQLEPSSSILMHHKNMSVIGILGDEIDPLVSVMKVDKAPLETYSDIGGLEEQIQEIKEAVELPLTHPELYEDVGIKPPKGVILYGVPGTGKTLLAKAVANETSATFLRVVGSELIQKYLGDGPKLVREMFRVAGEQAPSIVFIDEID